jgi:hypothetical protein
MSQSKSTDQLSAKDQLVTRPDVPLPTVQDPKQPRGEPADPKIIPDEGQASPAEAQDIGRTA